MNKPTYHIERKNEQYTIQLHDQKHLFILESTVFSDFRTCEKFLDGLRIHMCFQTNFSRCKNDSGLFGFEIRTCWDDLIATSAWFADRNEREDAMQRAFQSNKNAIFIHTQMYQHWINPPYTYKNSMSGVA